MWNINQYQVAQKSLKYLQFDFAYPEIQIFKNHYTFLNNKKKKTQN